LLKKIEETDSTIHPKTANGLVWRLIKKYPDKVHKTKEGLFRLLKNKD